VVWAHLLQIGWQLDGPVVKDRQRQLLRRLPITRDEASRVPATAEGPGCQRAVGGRPTGVEAMVEAHRVPRGPFGESNGEFDRLVPFPLLGLEPPTGLPGRLESCPLGDSRPEGRGSGSGDALGVLGSASTRAAAREA